MPQLPICKTGIRHGVNGPSVGIRACLALDSLNFTYAIAPRQWLIGQLGTEHLLHIRKLSKQSKEFLSQDGHLEQEETCNETVGVSRKLERYCE